MKAGESLLESDLRDLPLQSHAASFLTELSKQVSQPITPGQYIKWVTHLPRYSDVPVFSNTTLCLRLYSQLGCAAVGVPCVWDASGCRDPQLHCSALPLGFQGSIWMGDANRHIQTALAIAMAGL